jgi:D-tyrosyl-tRNA(Tyr) deacylase
VEVEGERVADIGAGLVVLVGVGRDDGPDDAAYIAGKVRDLRVFEDADGKMNVSVGQSGGAVLLVSQFTLYGDARKGRRPSLDAAASPEVARALFDEVAQELRLAEVRVETGVFRAHMQLHLVNDGPVTILLDSRKAF